MGGYCLGKTANEARDIRDRTALDDEALEIVVVVFFARRMV
jgi:hypothetical protein